MSAGGIRKIECDTSVVNEGLESGFFKMEVLALHQEALPRRPAEQADLYVRVLVPDLQQLAVADFSPHFLDFVRPGRSIQTFGDYACQTIEKFGTALQFKELVRVRFMR